MIAFLVFQILLNASLPEVGGEEIGPLRTDENEYSVRYYRETAKRVIPHGLIDQARESIVTIHGPEALLSYTRSFFVAPYTYGYTAHRSDGGVELYLIVCSKSNTSFISVQGTCTTSTWRRELFDLFWRSTETLDELDRDFEASEETP